MGGQESESVVCVHGLWMPGHDMTLLRRRLARCGFSVHQFFYDTNGPRLEDSVVRLSAFLKEAPGETVHLVGHSLGGLLIRMLLHSKAPRRPGRVVTLGTPHGGSRLADYLGRFALLRRLLGGSLPVLRGGAPPWHGERELGVIAGRLPIGVASLVRVLPRPHDGMVAVAETRLAGMDDHIVVPATHMGLLVAPSAAAQTCHFLHHGYFDHGHPQ